MQKFGELLEDPAGRRRPGKAGQDKQFSIFFQPGIDRNAFLAALPAGEEWGTICGTRLAPYPGDVAEVPLHCAGLE